MKTFMDVVNVIKLLLIANLILMINEAKNNFTRRQIQIVNINSVIDILIEKSLILKHLIYCFLQTGYQSSFNGILWLVY